MEIETLYYYLDHFADLKEYDNCSLEFREGYERACRDIFNTLTSSKLSITTTIHNLIIKK